MRLWVWATIAIVVALMSSETSFAQRRASAPPTTVTPTPQDASVDQEARDLYEAGRTAFDAGRYEAALRYFRDSLALSGRPELYFNVATSADRLRRDAEALEAFERFLELVPDSPLRPQIEGRVVVLRAAVASVPTPAEAAEAAEADANASDPALVDDTDAPRRRTGLWVGIGVGVAVVALALGLGFGLSGRGTSGVDATFSTLGARP